MLDQLPDVVLIHLFHQLPYGDRFKMERVCHRFNDLMKEVWNKKYFISYPYELRQINPRYPLSSYLDTFGPEMRILIDHCPNLCQLRFTNVRHLQIFMQVTCMTYFEPDQISEKFDIKEIFIDGLYITDVDVIKEMGRVFPNLEILTVKFVYPLMHRLRPDTMKILHDRIPNLEPQLWDLMDDNQRVTEDIRLYLELFPKLRKLKLKDADFSIVDVQ